MREIDKKPQSSSGRYEIYVDGSFINGATGYGVVVLKNGNVVAELSGSVPELVVDGSRQVAGELVAVKEALKWCQQQSISEVWIYYDYYGIEKWATRQWKANLPLTIDYARCVGECPIKIHWNKVNSHSGNQWNDRADLLAKQGAAAQQITSARDTITELIETKDAWIEFLMVRGLDAEFDRILNEQFARICIMKDGAAVGIFDLYNTKKKRLSPYLHDFRDEKLKLLIETLWRDFTKNSRFSDR
jgi:ribonuclease HI